MPSYEYHACENFVARARCSKCKLRSTAQIAWPSGGVTPLKGPHGVSMTFGLWGQEQYIFNMAFRHEAVVPYCYRAPHVYTLVINCLLQTQSSPPDFIAGNSQTSVGNWFCGTWIKMEKESESMQKCPESRPCLWLHARQASNSLLCKDSHQTVCCTNILCLQMVTSQEDGKSMWKDCEKFARNTKASGMFVWKILEE